MTLYALILGVALIYLFKREGQFVTVTSMAFGLLMMLYGFGHLYYYNVEDFDPTAEQVTISLGWMWIALMVGNEICRLAFPRANARQRSLIAAWPTLPMQSHPESEWLWRAILLVSTGLLALAFVAFGKVGALAHYATLSTAADLIAYRLSLGGEGGYLFQLFVTTIAPFLAVMSLLLAKRTQNSIDWFVALGLCGIVFLFKLATFHKAQWVWFLVEVGIGWYLIKRNRMRLGTGVLVLATVLLFFMFAASLAYPEIDTPALFKYVLFRVFDITNEGLYQTYYVYPQYLDHTHGLNIGLVHAIYGYGELIPAHTQVARFYGSYDSTFNAMFLADSWVDFGLGGVIGVSLVIGFLLKGVDLFIAGLGKTPVALALTAALFFGVISLASVSAFTSLLTGGVGLLPLFVVGVELVAGKLRHSRAFARGTSPAASGQASPGAG